MVVMAVVAMIHQGSHGMCMMKQPSVNVQDKNKVVIPNMPNATPRLLIVDEMFNRLQVQELLLEDDTPSSSVRASECHHG